MASKHLRDGKPKQKTYGSSKLAVFLFFTRDLIIPYRKKMILLQKPNPEKVAVTFLRQWRGD